MSKQKVTLGILFAVLLCSLIYSYFRMPRQQTVAPQSRAQSAGAQRPVVRPPSTAKPMTTNARIDNNQLQLALLNQQGAQFNGFRRNLFKPIFREEMKIVPLPPPPPAPPQKSTQPAKPVTAAPPVAPPPSMSPSETAKQEMGRLRFLGFLKKDARKTIFLAEGAEIFLVRKGDKIAGRYEVTALTDDAITISVLADKSDLVFPLVESRSLTVGRR
jgi:hypothetical protein